tara:strand:+ start:825 stop:1079 length:255 start_codon:yes stop_codon:yes gene_type:complete
MSDERIDLTQFENISSEGWEYLSDESRNINNAALDKIPDLIAELKRCYEEINLVHRNLSIVRNALARGYPDIEEEIWKLIDASE